MAITTKPISIILEEYYRSHSYQEPNNKYFPEAYDVCEQAKRKYEEHIFLNAINEIEISWKIDPSVMDEFDFKNDDKNKIVIDLCG